MNHDESIAHHCPAVVGINVDIESVDSGASGKAGLFGRYSYGRYGLREGVARLLGALAETEVRATFYAPVSDLQRHPELVGSFLNAGHEIAARGSVNKGASAEQQLDLLGEERATLSRLTGRAPFGWRSLDGIATQQTLPVLARLGYLYDSSSCDDDLPYALGDASGAMLVELPTMDYLADATFYASRHTHERVRKAWREEAEAQYRAGALVHLTLHTRGDIGSSRLPRVETVAQFLRWLRGKPGVRIYRACDLAQEVLARATVEPFPDAPRPQIDGMRA